MKTTYHLLFLIAINCLVCSCGGEEKATITLYEVENGDTVEVKHEITTDEIKDILVEGYQFDENALTLKYFHEEDIPSDLELISFLMFCSVDDYKTATTTLKSQMNEIESPVKARVYVYNDKEKDNTCIYFIDDAYPKGSMGVCIKNEGYNRLYELCKNENIDDAQVNCFIALYAISNSSVSLFRGYSFKSKSGIISRIITSCTPLEMKPISLPQN